MASLSAHSHPRRIGRFICRITRIASPTHFVSAATSPLSSRRRAVRICGFSVSAGQTDPRLKGISLLIIHGAGAESWRSATPQAKFVVINIAVKTVAVKKMKINKKKSTAAIYVQEATADQTTSAIYWDGKKYRYEPMGASME